MSNLESTINDAFDHRSTISPNNCSADVREAIDETLAALNDGKIRVAEKLNGQWHVNEWVKKAVLLSFRIKENSVIRDGGATYFDKVDRKFTNFDEQEFIAGGYRVVPPATVR
ncbi:MAG: 2,3,4,5-tetrahydropyridine-2,6-dicarboxylate N-succinyltransferase, partial [Gammaproteobacteria bacterium]|nr:2,3,4,5-tetrahydropyridine-2,6-dicarboxylate N-succinyltransferase [Gammaproteobacteria bacterium]